MGCTGGDFSGCYSRWNIPEVSPLWAIFWWLLPVPLTLATKSYVWRSHLQSPGFRILPQLKILLCFKSSHPSLCWGAQSLTCRACPWSPAASVGQSPREDAGRSPHPNRLPSAASIPHQTPGDAPGELLGNGKGCGYHQQTSKTLMCLILEQAEATRVDCLGSNALEKGLHFSIFGSIAGVAQEIVHAPNTFGFTRASSLQLLGSKMKTLPYKKNGPPHTQLITVPLGASSTRGGAASAAFCPKTHSAELIYFTWEGERLNRKELGTQSKAFWYRRSKPPLNTALH